MLRIKGNRGYSNYYVQCKILFSLKTTITIILIFLYFLQIYYFLSSCLDAEMKDSKRQGVSVQTKKEEKEAVTDENEEKFWSAGLFGSETAKQLLDTT